MEIYETHALSPELPIIFHTDLRRKNKSNTFSEYNWHENIEILLIREGSGTVQIDSTRHDVECGDIVVINANCMHGFAARGDYFTYDCLIVDRTFCISNYFDTNGIYFAPVFRDSEIADFINKVRDEFCADAPYRTQSIRAAVLSIMAALCKRHTEPPEQKSSDSHTLDAIKYAVAYIRTECKKPLTLDEVARISGISKFYFAREFKRITGYTFIEYLNITRCDKARTLLKENLISIKEVGEEVGFLNQSYFSKIFQTYVGKRPGEYRREKAGAGIRSHKLNTVKSRGSDV